MRSAFGNGLSADEIQGRVHATFVFVARGLQPLGSLAGGALGVVIGLPLTLVAGEIGMFIAFFWLLLLPVRNGVIAAEGPVLAGTVAFLPVD